MSTVSGSWERHLLNVGCARELGATFTKCRLCPRAGSDIIKCRLFASCDGRTKCRLLMIDSQAIFSKYRLFHE